MTVYIKCDRCWVEMDPKAGAKPYTMALGVRESDRATSATETFDLCDSCAAIVRADIDPHVHAEAKR